MQQRLLLSLFALLIATCGLAAADNAPRPTVDSIIVTITNPDTVFLCRGDTLELTQTNNVGDEIVWLRADGFIDPVTDPSPRIVAMTSGYVVLGAGPGIDSCDLQDSIYLDVNNLVVPELIQDTLICEGYPLRLVQNFVGDVGETVYDWGPGTFLEDSTDVNAVWIPRAGQDTLFHLIATAENGACRDSVATRVRVQPSFFEINQEDTVQLCVTTDTINLSVGSGLVTGTGIRWFPTAGIIGSSEGPSISVDVITDRTYYVEAEVNGCYQIDSVAVRVDSLPEDLSITLDPVKDPYCQGDTIILRTPTYDVGDYPLISHQWEDLPGLASPVGLLNAVAFASDSSLAFRINRNGACLDTSFVQINVIRPPILIFDPANPVICPGEPLQVNVSFDPSGPSGTLEWMDPIGGTLSCDDCLDPIVTTTEGVTYEIEVTAEGSECASNETYTVRIATELLPTLNDQTLVCSGDNRRIITGGVEPNYNYRITGPGVDSQDPNLVVTLTENATFTVETMSPCGTTTDQVSFEVVGDYVVTIEGDDVACGGDEVLLTATVNTDRNGRFIWTLPGGNTVEEQQIRVTPTATSSYSVVFIDNLCGNSAGDDITIRVSDDDLNPTIVASTQGVELSDMDQVFEGSQVTLTLLDSNLMAGATVEWEGNLDPTDATGMSIVVSVPFGDDAPSTLSYVATVTTADGCVFQTRIDLPIAESQNTIPEVISPNNDGTNDVFRVFFSGELQDFTLVVFNRWGQEVFSSNDPTEGWDGTKDGKPQNSDTYLYLARFTQNGVEFEEEGQFALVR